jgi:hypothetical protein
MLRSDHRYKFNHRMGDFTIDIFQSASENLTAIVETKGIICSSNNPLYKDGDIFIINSPLTITYNEIQKDYTCYRC